MVPKATILLVDEDRAEVKRKTVLMARHFPDWVVVVAEDAAEALSLSQRESLHCAVVHLNSNKAGGKLCAQLKRANASAFPVLLVTVNGLHTDATRPPLDSCADDFLEHPYEDKELVARLRVMLRIKHVEDDLRTANKRLATLASDRSVALRDTEERFRMLFDNNRDAVVTFSITAPGLTPGPIVEANVRACQLMGYGFQELRQRTVMDLLHPERAEAASVRMESLLTHRQVQFDTVLVTKAGQVLPVEINARLFEQPEQPLVLAICRSLVEESEPRLDVRDTVDRLQIVADHMGQVVYDYDIKSGSIRWIGPVQRLTGYPFRELDGASFDYLIGLVHADDQAHFRQAIEDAVANVGGYHTQYRMLHKSGVYRYIEDEGLALPGEDGRAYRVLGTAKDVTPRALEERQRQKYEREMQHSQRLESLGVLAGGIAHDFNNVLAAIIGLTDMALQDVDRDSPTYVDLQEALQAAHRAKELVKQILAFSRQTGDERVPLFLHIVIREALKLSRATLPATIEIVDNVDVHSGVVEADAAQMHQVFMNFCTNAAYAMRDTGGRIEVSLRDVDLDERGAAIHPKLQPGPYVMLAVRDTGHGMSPEILKRVFDPFFTTKGPGEGTGMGLSVVHGIINNHGGIVIADSEPGHGTTFIVYLPRVVAPVTEAPYEMVQLPKAEGRILFVDDEEGVRHFGHAALQRLGYDVVVAATGEEALALFEADPGTFDLLITDQVMPQMTGDELVIAARKTRADLPAILFTGFGERITEDKAQEAGICEIVTKPVVASELDAAIRRALSTT
ncbi:MAG: response regulator [Candidatus Hydrogenedentota bacterium]